MESVVEDLFICTEQYLKCQAPGHCQECPHLAVGFDTIELLEYIPYCKKFNRSCIDDPKSCSITLKTWMGFPLLCRFCPDVTWYSYRHAECTDRNCRHGEILESHIKKEEANVGPKS